jgi:hypothetical protein
MKKYSGALHLNFHFIADDYKDDWCTAPQKKLPSVQTQDLRIVT